MNDADISEDINYSAAATLSIFTRPVINAKNNAGQAPLSAVNAVARSFSLMPMNAGAGQ